MLTLKTQSCANLHASPLPVFLWILCMHSRTVVTQPAGTDTSALWQMALKPPSPMAEARILESTAGLSWGTAESYFPSFSKSHRSKTKVKQFPLLICSLTHQQTFGFYPDTLTWKPSSDPDTGCFTTLCNGWVNILAQFICSTKEGRNHLLHQLMQLEEMDRLQGSQTFHQIFSKQLKPPDRDQISSAKSRVLSITTLGNSAPSLSTSWERRTKWQSRHGKKKLSCLG